MYLLHDLTSTLPTLAFVITPAVRRTDITWDDDYTVIVGDWYHQENAWLVENEFLTWVSSPFVSELTGHLIPELSYSRTRPEPNRFPVSIPKQKENSTLTLSCPRIRPHLRRQERPIHEHPGGTVCRYGCQR
jgi:hypothetical protein